MATSLRHHEHSKDAFLILDHLFYCQSNIRGHVYSALFFHWLQSDTILTPLYSHILVCVSFISINFWICGKQHLTPFMPFSEITIKFNNVDQCHLNRGQVHWPFPNFLCLLTRPRATRADHFDSNSQERKLNYRNTNQRQTDRQRFWCSPWFVVLASIIS